MVYSPGKRAIIGDNCICLPNWHRSSIDTELDIEMASMKAVSVIIPAYNSVVCLKDAIESALSQQWPPMEVIVINDGSTDATADVARCYGKQIVYLEQRNLGQGAARNAGLRVARGEFIAFLDTDDYWLPDFLKGTTRFLLAHPKAIAVSTGYVIRRWGKKHQGPVGLMNGGGNGEGYLLENFFETWAKHDHVRTGTVLIRRDVIENAGPQLEIRISQDLEYWAYIATFGCWGFIPRPLWVGNSMSASATSGWSAKYGTRRRLCPTVEQWQRRIVPRLQNEDWPGFRIVRARVAMSFAHSKIMAGDDASAKSIVVKYGKDFCSSRTGKILVTGARIGTLGWKAVCYLLRLKEFVKPILLFLIISRTKQQQANHAFEFVSLEVKQDTNADK